MTHAPPSAFPPDEHPARARLGPLIKGVIDAVDSRAALYVTQWIDSHAEAAGLTPEQTFVLVDALSNVISEAADSVAKTIVELADEKDAE